MENQKQKMFSLEATVYSYSNVDKCNERKIYSTTIYISDLKDNYTLTCNCFRITVNIAFQKISDKGLFGSITGSYYGKDTIFDFGNFDISPSNIHYRSEMQELDTDNFIDIALDCKLMPQKCKIKDEIWWLTQQIMEGRYLGTDEDEYWHCFYERACYYFEIEDYKEALSDLKLYHYKYSSFTSHNLYSECLSRLEQNEEAK